MNEDTLRQLAADGDPEAAALVARLDRRRGLRNPPFNRAAAFVAVAEALVHVRRRHEQITADIAALRELVLGIAADVADLHERTAGDSGNV